MSKQRKELIEDMECDELCFVGYNKDLKEESKEERAKKMCPPCFDYEGDKEW